MGKVYSFPARRITSVKDLPRGAKALVISPANGGFVVTMEPAATDAERAVQKHFERIGRARAYCGGLMLDYPRLYALMVDRTGEPATAFNAEAL